MGATSSVQAEPRCCPAAYARGVVVRWPQRQRPSPLWLEADWRKPRPRSWNYASRPLDGVSHYEQRARLSPASNLEAAPRSTHEYHCVPDIDTQVQQIGMVLLGRVGDLARQVRSSVKANVEFYRNANVVTDDCCKAQPTTWPSCSTVSAVVERASPQVRSDRTCCDDGERSLTSTNRRQHYDG